MLEVLVIFSGLPFIFLATVAISPPTAEHIEFYEKFALISWLAFASYCLFPLYLLLNLIVEVAPRSPIMLTLDNVFELLLLLASIFLGWTLKQLAEAARKRAYSQAISRSLGPYIEPLSGQSAQPAPSIQSSKKKRNIGDKHKK